MSIVEQPGDQAEPRLDEAGRAPVRVSRRPDEAARLTLERLAKALLIGPVGRLLERGDPVVALGVTWLMLLLVQNASPNVLGIDGFYHIKMAWMIRQQGIVFDFPWLPLTILNPREFTNHHLLFHLLLVPFTYFDLRLGAKAAALVYGVLAVFVTYLVLVGLRVRYALVWLVVLLASGEWFLARLMMTRRQSVSLALLVLAIYLLLRGRYRWLVPLAFAYAWLFDGFVLLLVIAGLAFAARLLADRQLHWPILGWTSLGLALATLLNPFFPNNIRFTILHILPKVVAESQVTVGNEWYPYSTQVLLETSWLAVLLVPLALLPAVFHPERMWRDRNVLFLGGVALLFLALYIRSRRFIESEPAFAVLFCAYVWTYHRPVLGGRTLWGWVARPIRPLLLAALALGLAFQTWHTVREAQADTKDGHDYTTFSLAAAWLAENTAPGERVYQTDWDDFPELFFWNTHNTYIVGLDPTYMYLANSELYRLWRSIGRGQVDLPSAQIRDRFQSHWVITDREHRAFIEKATADPDLDLVFESANALIYYVRGP